MHITSRAPAKVNLSLLIGPRDDTGYHELFTVFAPIDVYDELQFAVAARPGTGHPGLLRVECPGVDGKANLVTRAFRALERDTGWSFAGRVTIAKGIPMGAGLGGGSADAAAALLAGAQLLAEAGGPAPDEAGLRRLARALGADVAFFLGAGPALGRGIGELLEPVVLPELPLVLILSDEPLSTAHVYRAFDAGHARESRESFRNRSEEAEAHWRDLERTFGRDPGPPGAAFTAVVSLLGNDLQETSFRLMPRLVAAGEALREEGALGALMSGSGPSLFGICTSRGAAEETRERLVARGFRAEVAMAAGRVARGSGEAAERAAPPS